MLKEKLAPIVDITPFTQLDYPEHLATILWFAGCNMRCAYCYNSEIVFGKGTVTVQEAIAFLESRRGLLDSVVLSGGEATCFSGLPSLCEMIKSLGFKIKLDTNGVEYEMIKNLVESLLIDYIALDYKAPSEKFPVITKNRLFSKFSQTLDFLIYSEVAFEVRTTIHAEILSAEDINTIIRDLSRRGYKNSYYLQHFFEAPNILGGLKKTDHDFEYGNLLDELKIVYR